MIDTILSCALPNRTPCDRTSPQLRELHVIQGNMFAQILLYMFTTVCTRARLCGPKPLSAVFVHLIQIELISGHECKQSFRPVQAKASKFAHRHKRQPLLLKIMNENLVKSNVHMIIRRHHPDTAAVGH